VSSNDSFSFSSLRLPVWAQATGALLIVGIILVFAMGLNPYVSTWDEESSGFFEDANQALKIFGINPTAPTAFIFWDKENADCSPGIRAFNSSPSNLRIYGIHLSNSDETLKIRQEWLKVAPRRASLIIDRSQMLQTSFHVRALPMVYIFLPKQKKIFSYLGNINDNRQKMLEIIKSE